MTVIRICKMGAEFFIINRVRWTVFGQYCAVIPLISNRSLSVRCKNGPLLGARSCIETHRHLGVNISLI